MHFSDERDRIAPVLSCQDKGRRGMEEKLVLWVESGSNSKSSVCGGRDPFILLLVAGVTSCLYNGYVLKKTPGVTINKVFSMNQLFENDEQL